MMTPDPADAGGVRDEELVRYLLGQLPEHEADRLDELSVTDDAIALRLRTTENDLVDAYVRGNLTGERRERFQTFYLSSPHRRRRVEFATAFQAQLHGAELETSAKSSQPAASGSRIDRTDRGPRAGRLAAWALAAAAIIAVAAASYFAVENRRLRQEIVQVQAARDAAVRTAEGLRTPIPVPALQPFLLLPMRRGAGDTPTVAIPNGAADAPFRLRLEFDDFPGYVVALKRSSTGQIVWRSGRLSAASADAARHVDVRVPAAAIDPDTYTFELSGIAPGGAAEFVTSYAFRVALK
jgi:hypothetical protein